MDNKPTQRAYLVEDANDDGRTYWTEIGAVWPHKDGKGSNLLLKGGGKIVIRDFEDEKLGKKYQSER